MDPADWPTWLKLVVGWGPLGIGWLWEARARTKAERDHHKTRDAHDEVIREIEAKHRQEINAVTDRMVKLVENQSRQAHRLADGVSERLQRRRRKEDARDEEEGESGGDAS